MTKILRAVLFEKIKNYQEVIQANSGRFKLNPIALNTEYSEYGPTFYGDKVVFAAATSGKASKGGVSQWTGEGFYDLYVADRNKQKLSNKKTFVKCYQYKVQRVYCCLYKRW